MKRVLFQGTYFEVPDWAEFLAKDEDGEIYAYENKPHRQDEHGDWWAEGAMEFVSREDVIKIMGSPKCP